MKADQSQATRKSVITKGIPVAALAAVMGVAGLGFGVHAGATSGTDMKSVDSGQRQASVDFNGKMSGMWDEMRETGKYADSANEYQAKFKAASSWYSSEMNKASVEYEQTMKRDGEESATRVYAEKMSSVRSEYMSKLEVMQKSMYGDMMQVDGSDKATRDKFMGEMNGNQDWYQNNWNGTNRDNNRGDNNNDDEGLLSILGL